MFYVIFVIGVIVWVVEFELRSARSVKNLRFGLAIIQIKNNDTIAFNKKKIYFCRSKKAIMLQRIQTVYLLLALITTGILPFFFPLWIESSYDTVEEVYFPDSMLYSALFGLSTALSLLSILFYKKRQHQFVIGRLNILLNLILLGLFVYHSLNLSGEATTVSEKGIGMFLPIFSIVFLALANKAIKKDEDLVKSVDRLR